MSYIPFLLGLFSGMLIGCLSAFAAYRNGLRDGYEAARRPADRLYDRVRLRLNKYQS